MDHEQGHVDATRPEGSPGNPLEILQRRYALGEISTEQFEEMKRVLGMDKAEPLTTGDTSNAWETGHHG
ncbi:MAG TPA: SHOCT domain-containing protein [Anaerolineales bacterium]|nr:SHOCT domain-containing protein [Anaerolineales bacterium]